MFRVTRSDVVMNPFIFLLTCYRPKYSFLYQFGKLITLIYNYWKAKLDSGEDSVQRFVCLISIIIKQLG